MGYTQEVTQFIQDGFVDIDQATLEQAKLSLLDCLAVTIVGSSEEPTKKMLKLIEVYGGQEHCTILGTNYKSSAPWSALINGISAHVLDFDDIHSAYPGHYTAPIIPSILALSEWKKIDGVRFLRALIIGAQVMGAIEAAIMPDHYKSGWHNTGTLGHFGAVAASSVLLDLNSVQATHALGIAAAQMSSTHASFGTMTKPFHAGKAAMNGLLSAMMAAEDFTGNNSIFDQEFLELYSTSIDYDNISRKLYSQSVLHELRFKQYPCGTATHPTIMNALKMREKYSIQAEQIKKVTLNVYPRAFQCAAIPRPTTGLEGKFSLHYCFARALIKGEVGLEAFTDRAVQDKKINELLPKIHLIEEQDYAATRTSSTIVELIDGNMYTETSRPFEDANNQEKVKQNIFSKFKSLLKPCMDVSDIDSLLDLIMKLEELEDMSGVIQKLSTALNR